MTRDADERGERPLRGELVPSGDPGSTRRWAELLVAQAREDGVALTGEGGLLTDLMRHILQTGLDVAGVARSGRARELRRFEFAEQVAGATDGYGQSGNRFARYAPLNRSSRRKPRVVSAV